MDVPAELIAQAYRLMWLIESFFRMIKQFLGCRQDIRWLNRSARPLVEPVHEGGVILHLIQSPCTSELVL
jgi:IS4 transposase